MISRLDAIAAKEFNGGHADCSYAPRCTDTFWEDGKLQTLRIPALAGRTPVSKSADHKDHPVVAEARSRLRSTGYTSVGRVECRFDDGTLVLTGKVTSYYQKQIAQAAVMPIEGVSRLVNDIEVRSRSWRQ